MHVETRESQCIEDRREEEECLQVKDEVDLVRHVNSEGSLFVRQLG